LHDGASAAVAIVYKQVTNVLTVPTAAVHSANGKSYVYVSSGGKKVSTTVTTGLSSGGTTEIKSGLKSGQQVYVEIAVGGPRSGSATDGQTNTQKGNYPDVGVFPGGGVVYPGGGPAVIQGGSK